MDEIELITFNEEGEPVLQGTSYLVREVASRIKAGEKIPELSEIQIQACLEYANANFIDKTRFEIVSMDEPDDSVEYWRTRPYPERIAAVQRLRVMFYGNAASEGFHRFLEITERA